jgi:hypothetical protein
MDKDVLIAQVEVLIAQVQAVQGKLSIILAELRLDSAALEAKWLAEAVEEYYAGQVQQKEQWEYDAT